MGNIISLMITSIAMAISIALIMVTSKGNLPLLCFIIPTLFFFRIKQPVTWALVIAMASFGAIFPHQSISVSITLWMLLPLLLLATNKTCRLSVSLSLLFVAISIVSTIVVLQNNGQLEGDMAYTLAQTASLVLLWLSIRFWKPIENTNKWPFLLVFGLLIYGMVQAALLALCGGLLLHSLQELPSLKHSPYPKNLPILLPTTAFISVNGLTQLDIPISLLISWSLLFTSSWLAHYLIYSKNR